MNYPSTPRQSLISAMPTEEISIGVNLDFRACRALVKMGFGTCELLLTPDEARKFGEELIGAALEGEVQGFLLDWWSPAGRAARCRTRYGHRHAVSPLRREAPQAAAPAAADRPRPGAAHHLITRP